MGPWDLALGVLSEIGVVGIGDIIFVFDKEINLQHLGHEIKYM